MRVEAAEGRGAAPEARAIGIHARARLRLDPADGGARSGRNICSTPANGSAGTGCCSPPTTRIGISTIRAWRCPSFIPEEKRAAIYGGNARRIYGVLSCRGTSWRRSPRSRRAAASSSRRRRASASWCSIWAAISSRCSTAARTRAARSVGGIAVRADPVGRTGHLQSIARRGEIIRCPWHYWEFDIRTGKSWFDPRRVQGPPVPGRCREGGRRWSRGRTRRRRSRCGSRTTTSSWTPDTGVAFSGALYYLLDAPEAGMLRPRAARNQSA